MNKTQQALHSRAVIKCAVFFSGYGLFHSAHQIIHNKINASTENDPFGWLSVLFSYNYLDKMFFFYKENNKKDCSAPIIVNYLSWGYQGHEYISIKYNNKNAFAS